MSTHYDAIRYNGWNAGMGQPSSLLGWMPLMIVIAIVIIGVICIIRTEDKKKIKPVSHVRREPPVENWKPVSYFTNQPK